MKKKWIGTCVTAVVLIGTGILGVTFAKADDKNIPSNWNFSGISCQEKKGQWVTCEIKNIQPDKALRLLVQKGMPITEAIQVNSGLESMYLNFTAQGKE